MTLAVPGCADPNGGAAVRLDSHRPEFALVTAGRDFDIGTHTNAHLHSVTVGSPLGLLTEQLWIIRGCQSCIQRELVAADIVGSTGEGRIRKLLGLQQIAPTKLARINA